MAEARVDWTAENIQKMRDGAAAGLTTQQVSDQIGGDSTRFAVLGKAKRLGVTFKPHPGNARANVGKPKEPKPRPSRPPKPDRTLGDRLMVAVEDIAERASACRWPIGDPHQPGFRFCGDAQQRGKPYCEDHWKVAHQKATGPVNPHNREALRPGQTSLWR